MKFSNFNNFQNLTKIKNLFLSFVILFFLLIIFNKFSITGDTQYRLECIKLLSHTGVTCIEQIYYHFNFHIFILFFIKIAEGLSFLFPLFNTLSENFQKIYFEAFLSIIFYSFFILNVVFLIFYSAKKNNNFKINFSIPIIFLFTSYLGNFLNFEHFEIILANLFTIKLIIIEQNKKNNLIFILILDLIILTSKIYYLPAVVILNILFFKRKIIKLFVYNFIISIISLVIFKLKSDLISQEGEFNFDSWYKPNFEIFSIIENIFLIFLSPSIGLVVTAPLILFSIFFSIKKFETKIKFLSLLSLVGVLSLFYFWHGNGSSGSRYLYPILILFYNEFENLFLKFSKNKLFKYFVFVIFLSFFQSLNYHSPVLLFSYTDSKVYSDYKVLSEKYVNIIPEKDRFPKYNFKYSPQYFGWNMEIKKIINEENIILNIRGEEKIIELNRIIPNTLISRLYHIPKNISDGEDLRIKKYNINKLFLKLRINTYVYMIINIFYFFLFFKLVFSKKS